MEVCADHITVKYDVSVGWDLLVILRAGLSLRPLDPPGGADPLALGALQKL